MSVIIITGASDGLGEGLVRSMSEKNIVVALARNEEKLKKLSEETDCEYIVCDIRSAESVKEAFEEIAEKHEKIDVLINNAGVIVNGDITETDDDVIENVMTTNAIGSIYVEKYALKQMKRQGFGQIINVISTAGITARANRSVYNASKWSLSGFSKATAEEAAEYGVRITSFYPGTINTKLFEKAGLQLGSKYMEIHHVVSSIQFILDQPNGIVIPHFEMRPF
jgi:short-subunit dehydrogenase